MILILKITNLNKSPILINNVDIIKIAVSNKVSSSKEDFKYFIGHKDAKK